MSNLPTISEPLLAYPGHKSRSLHKLLLNIPVRDKYIEAFGGTGIFLLHRPTCDLEVYNDVNSGMVSLYRVIQNPELKERLIHLIEISPYSAELFEEFRDTWRDEEDLVTKAYKYYYMMRVSFGGMGRHFGRSLTKNSDTQKLYRNLPLFDLVHDRLQDVYIENRSVFDSLDPYDSPGTVFYLDPPYLDCQNGTYKGTAKFTFEDHLKLLVHVFRLKGFVAVSGYDNPYYDEFPWTNKISWEVTGKIKVIDEGHGDKRPRVKECLWIKESK